MMKSSLYKGFQWVYEGHIEWFEQLHRGLGELQAAQGVSRFGQFSVKCVLFEGFCIARTNVKGASISTT